MNRLVFSIVSMAVATISLIIATPALAQIIQLGDDIRLDLSDDNEREIRPRISSDGDRLNLEVYEQEKPETEIRLSDDGLEIRETQPLPRQRLDLSIPLDEE
jgi:hypothetical protein